ncbi:MAG: hypothetical protein ACYCZN_10845 [Candidatus Dormibacteria bacterium]
MGQRRIYHDLIQVRDAIYWLRLYAGDDGGHIAVVTEVPGNPGLNSMNGLESIVYYLRDALKVEPTTLVLFQIWPSGYSDTTTEISRVVLDGPPRWPKVSRAEIESLVGKLPPLPDHETLLERVAALGGWVSDPIPRHVFRAIPVGELPPPHAPFRCAHSNRYDQILVRLGSQEGDDLVDRELRAGMLFLQSLTEADLAVCSWHQADWRSIANQGVAVLEELGARDDKDYEEAARKRLRGQDRGLLESLFRDPILVGRGGYTNGQHRGCALRFSGAERAVVVIGTEESGEFEYPWSYQGDG